MMYVCSFYAYKYVFTLCKHCIHKELGVQFFNTKFLCAIIHNYVAYSINRRFENCAQVPKSIFELCSAKQRRSQQPMDTAQTFNNSRLAPNTAVYGSLT